MILNNPIEITPRLLPGVRVDGATISITYATLQGWEGRTRYRYYIDPIGYTSDDLQSGACGGGLQEGLESLLCFLSACGEAFNYRTRTGTNSDNVDLFPPDVAEWASNNVDELTMLQLDLETKGLIEE